MDKNKIFKNTGLLHFIILNIHNYISASKWVPLIRMKRSGIVDTKTYNFFQYLIIFLLPKFNIKITTFSQTRCIFFNTFLELNCYLLIKLVLWLPEITLHRFLLPTSVTLRYQMAWLWTNVPLSFISIVCAWYKPFIYFFIR